jgi:hypothetical protein
MVEMWSYAYCSIRARQQRGIVRLARPASKVIQNEPDSSASRGSWRAAAQAVLF